MWKQLGRVLSAPVRVPVRLVQRKVEATMLQMVLGMLRHVMTTFGGGFVATGVLSDSELQTTIGAILTIIGVAASVYEKWQLRKQRLAVQAQADARVPLGV